MIETQFNPDAILRVMRAGIRDRDAIAAAISADLLDGWLTAGGAYPTSWSADRRQPPAPKGPKPPREPAPKPAPSPRPTPQDPPVRPVR